MSSFNATQFARLRVGLSDLAASVRSVEMAPRGFGTAPKCPKCERFVGSKQWIAPYAIEVEMPYASSPHVLIDVGPELMISDWLLTRLVEKGMRIDVDQAVEVLNASECGWAGPKLWHVALPRLEYEIDLEKSSIKASRIRQCNHCLGAEYHAGNRIVARSLNGCIPDVFLVDAIPGVIFVSARTANALESENLVGCQVTPTEMLRVLSNQK